MINRETLKIAKETWRRFMQALKWLVQSKSGTRAIIFFAMLLGLMIAINGLNVINSYVGRDFMSAIENRNQEAYYKFLFLYLVVFGLSTVVAVFFRFTEERLGILWREQMTGQMLDYYMDERKYYQLTMMNSVANPDQRIAEDVKAFTSTTLSFTLLILNGTVTAISFSGVLWSISPKLFVIAVLYSACGSLLTIYLGKRLIRLNYQQSDLEANFRAELIHVRENSESIALAHREGRFRARLHKRLYLLALNFRGLIRVNRNLGFFTIGYNYMIQLIPAMIVAPLFIAGEVKDFGVITQSAMAFAMLLGAFSLIVNQFQSISAFTAVTARLYQLNDAMHAAENFPTCSFQTEVATDRLVYEDVTLHNSDLSEVLISKLTMQVERGQCWLVTAPDEAKVALFRATAAVRECGGGKILRPSLDELLFLPERPYLPPGTLREILLRTGMENTIEDDQIDRVLTTLHLESALEHAGGLDQENDWDEIFSIGEQQLIAVARLLLAKPSFVFLDRPGSSLAKPVVGHVLELLKKANIGVMVLSKNGESRLRYDAVLKIAEDGSWQIQNAPPAKM